MPHVDVLSSRHNALVTRCRQLARDRQRGDPVVLLVGAHLLGEAIAAGWRVESGAFTSRALDGEGGGLASQLARQGARVVHVSDGVMQAMSPERTPSGVVAVAHAPPRGWTDVLSPFPALVLVAVDVQDPGNVGAIIRSADAAGATGVVVAGRSSDPFGWKALRGAMGSACRVPVIDAPDAAPVLETLRGHGVRLLASVPHDGVPLYAADLTTPTALLVGNEGAGLPDDLLRASDARITIPMRRGVESLNVAVAAALVAFEARRQRCG